MMFHFRPWRYRKGVFGVEAQKGSKTALALSQRCIWCFPLYKGKTTFQKAPLGADRAPLARLVTKATGYAGGEIQKPPWRYRKGLFREWPNKVYYSNYPEKWRQNVLKIADYLEDNFIGESVARVEKRTQPKEKVEA